MQKLAILKTLLEMTRDAEAIAWDKSEIEKLRSLIGTIKKIAMKELSSLKNDPCTRDPKLLRFRLCLTGICEELGFRTTHLTGNIDFGPRLGRIGEEIERSINEVESRGRAGRWLDRTKT